MAIKERHGVQELSERLGRQIALLRERRGLSQESLAGRLGVGRDHVAKLEVGVRRPSLELLFMMSRALGVEPYELLDFREQASDWRGAIQEATWDELRELMGSATDAQVRLLLDLARQVFGLMSDPPEA